MNELNIYTDLVYGKYNIIEDTTANIQHLNCYLALQAALQRDMVHSRKFLELVEESRQSEFECYVEMEARALNSYFLGNTSDAKSFAVRALDMENTAFFARSLMARFAGLEKNFPAQIEQYEIILKFYPEHSNSLLDLAQAIISSRGSYQTAINHVLKAKGSFRRFMYMLLFPLGLPLVRFAIAVIFLILFSLPFTGTVLFLILSICTVIGFIITIINLKWDSLIASRLFALQFIATIFWILSRYIGAP